MLEESSKQTKAKKVEGTRDQYSRYYETVEIDENVVLYITNRAVNISGNTFGIFKILLELKEYEKLRHYWAISDKKAEDEEKMELCENHPRVKMVKMDSSKYLKALAKAKYIVYEHHMPTFFIKKKGQVCINAWDETPLKKIGIHENKTSNIWNTQRNFFSCDYLISPSRYATEKIFEAYNIRGLFDGTVIETGHLSSTLLNRSEREPLIERLEVQLKCNLKGRKIILYTPAARKINGKYVDNSKVIQKHVAKIQKELTEEYAILVKLEPSDLECFKGKKIDFLLAPEELEIRKLFEVTDILVTDYNNFFFEFLNTGLPILFFLYDRDKSTIDQEVYLDLDTLPGPVCGSTKRLIAKIKDIQPVMEKYSKIYEEFARTYAPLNDGQAIHRVINIIFNKEKNQELSQYTYREENHKKRILLHIGLLNQIIDREICFSILKKINYEENIVVVDGNDIYPFLDEFSYINEEIRIVNSKYEKNKTESENEILQNSENLKDENHRKLFHREFLSMYGGLKFDTVIDAQAKKSVWMNVFAALSETEKIIYANLWKNTEEVVKEYVDYLDKVVIIDGDPEIEEVDPRITFISTDEFLKENIEKHALNVLFLSAFDSTNYVFVNLIKALKKRGHHCTVIVKDKEDKINNKMYLQENIPFIEVDDYNLKLINFVDFVFSAPLKYDCYNTLYKKLNAADKFIITFASLFSSIVMGVNPDLALSIGTSKFAEFEENGLKYNQVAIGNPQYDKLVKLRNGQERKDIQKIKNVLMIEQGAYPYGIKGKTQLADVLCHIARNNPLMTFTVKPRYLPSETGKQLHVLSEHLYDFIENKPENLVLLTEPVVLEDIMPDFDATITTWSTAYLDAALLGLPLILIEGLHSNDVYNVRNQRIDAAYNRLRHSGCVVNYQDLYENPLPFKYVDENYLSEEIYDPYNPCVPRIMELLEYLYTELIVTEKRWKKIHQFEFTEFKEKSHEIALIDVKSNEFQQRKKLFSEVNKHLQKFIFENRCMGQAMDITPLYYIWDYNVTEETTKEEIKEAIEELKNGMEKVKDDFFTNQLDMVTKDRILQDYYFQWMFQKKMYKEILGYNDILICPESLYFYKALVLYKKHRYKTGTRYMAEFLEISGKKETKDLRKDMAISSYLWKGRLAKYLILLYLDKYQAYEAIGSLDSQNVIYQRDIMLYFRVKSLMKRGLEGEAVDLCHEYRHTMLKKSKNPSLKQRVKRFVGDIFYHKTEALIAAVKK